MNSEATDEQGVSRAQKRRWNSLEKRISIPLRLLIKLPIRSLYYTSNLRSGDMIALGPETQVYLEAESGGSRAIRVARLSVAEERTADIMMLQVRSDEQEALRK